MKNIYTLFVCLFLSFASVGQCPSNSDFLLTYTNVPPAGFYNNSQQCNIANDLNNIQKDEIIFLQIDLVGTPSWNLINNPYVNLSVQGSGAIAGNGIMNINFPIKIPIRFTSVGSVSLNLLSVWYQNGSNSSSSCTLFQPLPTVNVIQRTCPLVTAYLQPWNCSNLTSLSYDHTLSSFDGSATILSSLWDFGAGGIQTGTGTNFTFQAPQGDEYIGTGVALVQLSNGSTCSSEIFNISTWNCSHKVSARYLDSYFELSGSLTTGSPINLVYKGTLSYPQITSYNTNVKIYDGGTLITSFTTPLNYNQVLYTFPSLSSGIHQIKLVLDGPRYNDNKSVCPYEYTRDFIIESLPPPCMSCQTFMPIPQEKYWVSAWVREDQINQVMNYTNSKIELEFSGPSLAPIVVPFIPSCDII